MPDWVLHTNEGTRYVRRVSEESLRRAMTEYIKHKRKQGHTLKQIMFCWGPIRWTSLAQATRGRP